MEIFFFTEAARKKKKITYFSTVKILFLYIFYHIGKVFKNLVTSFLCWCLLISNYSVFQDLPGTVLKQPVTAEGSRGRVRCGFLFLCTVFLCHSLVSFLPWVWPKEVHDHEGVFWFHLDCYQFLKYWAVTQQAEVVPICRTKNKNEMKSTFSSSCSFPFTLLLFLLSFQLYYEHFILSTEMGLNKLKYSRSNINPCLTFSFFNS